MSNAAERLTVNKPAHRIPKGVVLRSILEGIAISLMIFLAMMLVFVYVPANYLTPINTRLSMPGLTVLMGKTLWLHVALGASVGLIAALLRLRFGRVIQYGVLPTVVLATIVCSTFFARSTVPSEFNVKCLTGGIYLFYAATVVALSKKKT